MILSSGFLCVQATFSIEQTHYLHTNKKMSVPSHFLSEKSKHINADYLLSICTSIFYTYLVGRSNLRK